MTRLVLVAAIAVAVSTTATAQTPVGIPLLRTPACGRHHYCNYNRQNEVAKQLEAQKPQPRWRVKPDSQFMTATVRSGIRLELMAFQLLGLVMQ